MHLHLSRGIVCQMLLKLLKSLYASVAMDTDRKRPGVADKAEAQLHRLS